MGVRSFVQVELGEDLLDVGFDGPFGDEQLCGDGAVGASLGHQCKHFPLPRCQRVEWILAATATNQPGDDGGVDHGLALGDPSERIDQDRHVEDALLE